jgi:hypothetical protein
LWITDVAFRDSRAAQRAVFVRARDAIINENEPWSVWQSIGGEARIGTHTHLSIGSSPLKISMCGLIIDAMRFHLVSSGQP